MDFVNLAYLHSNMVSPPKLTSSAMSPPHFPPGGHVFSSSHGDNDNMEPDHRAVGLLHMIIIMFSSSPVEYGFSIMNLYFIISVDHFHQLSLFHLLSPVLIFISFLFKRWEFIGRFHHFDLFSMLSDTNFWQIIHALATYL